MHSCKTDPRIIEGDVKSWLGEVQRKGLHERKKMGGVRGSGRGCRMKRDALRITSVFMHNLRGQVLLASLAALLCLQLSS